jgi:hypothetical protein
MSAAVINSRRASSIWVPPSEPPRSRRPLPRRKVPPNWDLPDGGAVFSWTSRYLRLNIIFDRIKEHLVAFIGIAFVSILTRRLNRLASEDVID